MLINSIYLKAERILLDVTKIQVRCIIIRYYSKHHNMYYAGVFYFK